MGNKYCKGIEKIYPREIIIRHKDGVKRSERIKDNSVAHNVLEMMYGR